VTRFALLFLSLAPASALAAGVAGRVVALTGDAKVEHTHDGGVIDALVPGREVHEGDVVSTAANSRVRLLMRDKGILDLGAQSRLAVRTYNVNPAEKKRTVQLQMLLGRIWARVTKSVSRGPDFEISTTNAVAGIRGTQLVVDVSESGDTSVTVVEGSVQVSGSVAEGDGQLLGAMQRGRVQRDGNILVDKVTAEEISDLEASVRPSASLDSGDTEQRLGEAAAQAPRETTPAQGSEPGDEGPQIPDVGQPPAIELDPGAGTTHVNGKLEVRE
jgi:hypothetical protein